MTQEEACVELARRFWPDAIVKGGWGHATIIIEGRAVKTNCPPAFFKPFDDRDSADHVVAWFAKRRAPHPDWQLAQKFMVYLSPQSYPFWDGITATPKKIALAACHALGIEVEVETLERLA